jgi:hypothetical protein
MPSGVLDVLREAVDSADVVTIERRADSLPPIRGVVVDVGPLWLLVHLLDWDTILNGYDAIPIVDVLEVASVDGGGPDSFPTRALRYFSQTPTRPEGIELNSIPKILTSAVATYGLVTIYTERLDPDSCFIGTPIGAITDTVTLREMTTDAEWATDGEPAPLTLADITRIGFGGRYEEALLALSEGRVTRRD